MYPKQFSDFSSEKNTHFSFFYCERSELQICRVHELGLECIKNGALFVRCWICPAIKNVGGNRGEMGISLVTQDATHKGFCRTFPLYTICIAIKNRRREPRRDGKFLSNTGFYA